MEYTLSSGARLTVTEAGFADADALTKAVLKSVRGVPLPDDLMSMPVDGLKDVLISAVVSDEVSQAFFRCAKSAVYENVRVIPGLFDDPKLGSQARKDYYEILWRVAEVNSGPFFASIFSRLKGAVQSKSASQESQ